MSDMEYENLDEMPESEPDHADDETDEPGTYEEPETWVIEGMEYTQEELAKICKDHQNGAKWQTAHQAKSEQLKKEREEFKQNQTSERDRLKKREQGLRDQEGKLNSQQNRQQQQTHSEAVKEHENKQQRWRDSQDVMLDMKRSLDDYDSKAINEHMKQYNLVMDNTTNIRDAHMMMYHCWKGANFENEKAELTEYIRKEVVKGMMKKKGAPATGMQVPSNVEEEKVTNRESFISKMKGLGFK